MNNFDMIEVFEGTNLCH